MIKDFDMSNSASETDTPLYSVILKFFVENPKYKFSVQELASLINMFSNELMKLKP